MAKKYRDEPRYKAINGYEKQFKQQFSITLKVALKDIEKKMVSLTQNK